MSGPLSYDAGTYDHRTTAHHANSHNTTGHFQYVDAFGPSADAHTMHQKGATMHKQQQQQQQAMKTGGVSYPSGDTTVFIDGVPVDAVPPHQPSQAQTHARMPTSYATAAYREFLASGNSSNASSAASSAYNSRASSGYTSQAMSAQSSRATTPSRRDDLERGVPFETIREMASLTLAGNSYDSTDEEDVADTRVRYEQPRPRLRPNHFTFCQDDITKSFQRAAEKERQRAEREERAREATQREQELRQAEQRRLQKELAARESAYAAAQAAHVARDTVGADYTSADEAERLAYVHEHRRRRRMAPNAAHFKFSTHDVNKSASKPSQRQAIGHWTTFPRSSTVMISAPQLRAWIDSLIAAHEAERQRAAKQAAAIAAANEAARGVQLLARRSSLPVHIFESKHAHGNGTTSARPTHTRSRTDTAHTEAVRAANALHDRGFPRASSEKSTPATAYGVRSNHYVASHTRASSGGGLSNGQPNDVVAPADPFRVIYDAAAFASSRRASLRSSRSATSTSTLPVITHHGAGAHAYQGHPTKSSSRGSSLQQSMADGREKKMGWMNESSHAQQNGYSARVHG